MENSKKEINLLLVDDEDDFRASASKALERQGFRVLQAQDGLKAVDLLQKISVDVVVLDLKMPGIDGITTLGLIRKIDPRLPVVILTGHGTYENAVAGIQLDIVDFVHKPIDMKDLGQRILSLVSTCGGKPLREKKLEELMVPADKYQRISIDLSILEAVELLHKELMNTRSERNNKMGKRALLVFEADRFVDIICASDIARLLEPEFLRESEYASFFTGMFLAQSRITGRVPLQSALRGRPRVQVDASLMEAVHLLVSENLNHLPVMDNENIVGVLRPDDLISEILIPDGLSDRNNSD